MAEQAYDPSEIFQSQMPALQVFTGLGYIALSPTEALALRGGRRRNPLLESVLAEQLVRLNKITFRGSEYPLDPADAHEAIRKLFPEPEQQKGLKASNQEVYDSLVLGATIAKTIDGDTKSHQVKYIDWEIPSNNVFHVTTEYVVERTGSMKTRRLDVVAFVNGIPFVAVECKRPSEEIKKADHQLIRYQKRENIPEFFHFAQLLIATNRREATYATVGTPSKFWSPWREEDDHEKIVAVVANTPLGRGTVETLFRGTEEAEAATAYFDAQQAGGARAVSEQDSLLHSLCRPERLLELIRTFTVYDNGTRKIARHQQYFAVKRAIERVTSGVEGEHRPGGVVWHTQGSGKSLTMVMFAKALEFEPGIRNPRIILVTDRDDLDLQIRDTFRACQLDPVRARTGKHLAELIHARAPLVTTIVNKFENASKLLSQSGASNGASNIDKDPNLFVLVDESHRSHSTHLGQFGALSKRMHQVLPMASYIGFTGTPLLKKEKNTFRTFGGPIHTYTIADAVRDEAVVPLLYEGRMVEQQISENIIDRWFEKICQGLTAEQQADLKRKFSRADVLAGAGQVIRAKAFDISEHYRQYWQGTGFKAQLVASNKAAAIRFKQVLDEIGHVTSEVMISAPGESEDETADSVDRESLDVVQKFWDAAMERYGGVAAYNRDVVKAFKSSGGPEILIVVSKLLTGFDAPRNTVLYLCRSLREHTLLQAIARVNRLFDAEDGEDAVVRSKEFGYIIDYEGLLGELDAALTTYSSLEGFELEELLDAVIDVREQIRLLPERWNAVWSLFQGIRHDDMEALEQVLADKALRDEFYDCLLDFTRTLHIALSSDKVEEVIPADRLERYKADWNRFVNLRRSVQWRYLETVDLRDYEPKIKRLLDDHLQAMPAEVLIPELNLNDPASLQAVVDETGAGAAAKADRIAAATRKRITERMSEDPALYARFAALLQEAINEYRARRLSEIEYLNSILSLTERVASGDRGRALPDAVAHDDDAASFFEAIADRFMDEKGQGADSGENQAAAVAVGLVDIVRSHMIVGFWQNEPARMGLLNAIDDYLWDVVPTMNGASLSAEDEEAIRESVVRIAKARFP
ncbi:restriction endonuclease subunit R [Arthrobacter sp. AQ5-05]|uniref:type I restriction endonuclease subunit R n=1 Tax=Arthrobacter sp. AQ5-05 TaxID=2184581 RepID=UPI000DCF1078|nr:type I restriction endonuclease subunit R [Arthrobacter sp. AQ5-05]RAX50311.1 restriction endonuclease subunit R [Arthrobacter sp. AQ5-05]